MVHQSSIDFGRYDLKSVLEIFFIIFGISLTVIKLQLSCNRLPLNNPGGLVVAFFACGD